MFQIGDVIYCKRDTYEFGIVESFTKKNKIRVRLLKPTKIIRSCGYSNKVEIYGEKNNSPSVIHIQEDGFYVNRKKIKIQYHKFIPQSDLPTCPFLTINDIVIKYHCPIIYFLASIIFLIVLGKLYL